MKPRTDFETRRADELLVKRATEGLDAREAEELSALGADDDESVEQAAALVDITTLRHEPMPSALVDKVLAAALGPSSASSTAPAVPVVSLRTDHVPVVTAARATTPSRAASSRRRQQILLGAGWATALVAACVAVYLGTSRSAPAPAPAASRSSIDATTDVRTYSWSPSTGVSGTVTWSRERQRGYATLRGLPANDPAVSRYQLWIFDETRDERYPVDGGLFDASGTEIVIDIAPRIHVERASSFMVTLEQPAGVVVSLRERVIAKTE